MAINHWDFRFLELAQHISKWSKDLSTKCGAIIVRPDRTIASLGYNGFPRGIKDSIELLNNREEKYRRVVHGEMNALLNSSEKLEGYTLYNWPFLSCERCAVHIIQTGISRIVTAPCPEDKLERWGESFKLSEELFLEAKIPIDYLHFQKTDIELPEYATDFLNDR